jgi:hypothetical protein
VILEDANVKRAGEGWMGMVSASHLLNFSVNSICILTGHQWFMPVIPATQKAEIRRIMI